MGIFLKRIFVFVIFSCTGCVKTPITGKSAFIVTSESQEAKLGEEAYQQLLQESTLSKAANWNEIVKRVSLRIATVADKPDYKWEFKIIESEKENAFCLPGGKIAIYTGILKSFENEAQMATVVGHEVGHAIARHAGQRITLQFGTEIAFASLQALMGGGNSNAKNLLLAALGLGTTVGVELPFSRSQETEADYIGLVLMSKAGYEPNASLSFWDTFGKKGAPPEFLSTHPSSEHRKKNLESHMGAANEQYSHSPKYGEGQRFPP